MNNVFVCPHCEGKRVYYVSTKTMVMYRKNKIEDIPLDEKTKERMEWGLDEETAVDYEEDIIPRLLLYACTDCKGIWGNIN